MSVTAGPGSVAWRAARLDTLLTVAARSRIPTGFAWLDDSGHPDASEGLHLWINARMTYVFALASLRGESDAPALAEHGVETLAKRFGNTEDGGFAHQLASDGSVRDPTRSCYDHAFVVLASATAHQAAVPGAGSLLEQALDVHAERFWDERSGACRESWDPGWRHTEDYRGANSNMHTVEAYLVAADVTGDPVWRRRALRIAEHIVRDVAAAHDDRVVEHFSATWTPQLELNRDRPDDPFRPYGATPGHAFEWARLLLQLEAASPDPPRWLAPAAVRLFDRAAADTNDGLVYTTDWSGRPVVGERFHWVLCEALQSADVLGRRTRDPRYDALAADWWRLADEHFIDPARGSWVHELDASLRPSSRTWHGRPDAYHALNALLFPDLPLAPSAAVALSR